MDICINLLSDSHIRDDKGQDGRDKVFKIDSNFHMCISFNYSVNIRKISDIKKSRGNYFAKK